jgi:hypothetical protein
MVSHTGVSLNVTVTVEDGQVQVDRLSDYSTKEQKHGLCQIFNQHEASVATEGLQNRRTTSWTISRARIMI